MRSSLFIICFLSLVLTSFSQGITDSLKRELSRSSGTLRVDVLNQLTYEYIGTDNKQTLARNEEALTLANKLQYFKGIGTAHVYRGVYEYLSGENEKGIEYLKKGLTFFVKVEDRQMKAYAYLQLGNSYMNLWSVDSSLLNYNRAYAILKDSLNPVNLSKLYKNLGTLYGLRSLNDAQIKYLDRSLAIREKLGDAALVADALVEIGRLNVSNSNFDLARQYLARAEKILQSNPSDQENLNDYRYAKAMLLLHDTEFEEAYALLDSARGFYERKSMLMKMVTLHIDMGTVFMARGEYEVALKNYYTALRFAESKRFLVQVMDIQVKMGWVNYYLGEYQRSLELGRQSLLLAEERDIIDRVGNAYALLGVTQTELKNFKEAEQHLEKALSIRLRSNDPTTISETYVNLGYLKENEKNYATAQKYYTLSADYAKRTNYLLGLAGATLGLGKLSIIKKDYHKATALLNEAEEHVGKIQANEVLIKIYESRRDLLAEQGMYKQSLHFSMLADQWKDSLHRKDLARRFTNLQKIEEIERRDRDIEVLEQQQQQAQEKISYQQRAINQQYMLIAAAVIALGLLAVIAIVYARFYFKIKRLHALIEERNRSIQLQADKLREANTELGKLYKEVMEQKEEIQAQTEEITENYEHIRTMNENLQVLVDEKTRDLLKTNQELIKQNNELLQFSYTVSHNLRGPVARLLGLSDLLLKSDKLDEHKEYSQLIYKTSQDLDGVIRDLNKIIDVRNELHQIKEQVDLEREWNKCCDLVRELIPPTSEITANFEVKEIFTIRAMVHSIFYNLLSNAIKYKSPKRELKVTLSSYMENGVLRINFEDNGLGIDLGKHQSSLFKLFKRFHTHVEGKGLGLYLIKSQIESLNGTIHVSSKVDQGTRFEILLPEIVEGSGDEVRQTFSTNR